MKRMTICWTAMAMLVMGTAACDSGITGPEEADKALEETQGPSPSDPPIAAAKHRKARMGRNPRTG